MQNSVNQNKDMWLAELEATSPAKQPTAQKRSDIDPLLIAYLCIYKSVLINRDTAQIDAKQLQANADEQDKLIKSESQVKFKTISNSLLFTRVEVKNVHSDWGFHKPRVTISFKTKLRTHQMVNGKKVTFYAADMLQKYQINNVKVSGIQSYFQQQVNEYAQTGQIDATGLSTLLNTGVQTIQQASYLMNVLAQLTQQISRV